MEKRYLISFAICFALLFALLICMPQPFEKLLCRLPSDFKGSMAATVFCRQTLCSGATDVGNGFLVQCAASELPQTLASCRDVDGISVKFSCTQAKFEQILRRLKVTVVHSQNLENLTVVCGVSPLIKGGVVVDGRLVNIQLAFDGFAITVGSPLILGEY